MYNAVIVDDEEIARIRLRRLLIENFNDINIAAEASNALSGIDTIRNIKPDIVFLDIEMPGMSGIEIAHSCCHDIFVIFITAHNKYVFDAFKTLAVDYILKPFTIDELRPAIDKFKRIYHLSKQKPVLPQKDMKDRQIEQPHKLKVSVGTTRSFISYAEVMYFESDNKYTTVFTSDYKHYIIDYTLQELETLLSNTQFIRIHRKYIVNNAYIKEIKRLGDRKYKVLLNDANNKELLTGRHYLANLKKLS